MDTSETYIKMRLTAIKYIERGSKPERYGIAKNIIEDYDYISIDMKGNWYVTTMDYGGCQLERQDQLQEMIDDFKLPERLPWFYDFAVNDVPGKFVSMEQLWLAFVMKEKYGKTWNGEEWV